MTSIASNGKNWRRSNTDKKSSQWKINIKRVQWNWMKWEATSHSTSWGDMKRRTTGKKTKLHSKREVNRKKDRHKRRIELYSYSSLSVKEEGMNKESMRRRLMQENKLSSKSLAIKFVSSQTSFQEKKGIIIPSPILSFLSLESVTETHEWIVRNRQNMTQLQSEWKKQMQWNSKLGGHVFCLKRKTK